MPTPTDYINPIIIPEQLRLLDTRELFADVINHIVNTYFPLDLSTAVCQYQYFRETEYAIQCTIRNLQDKEMRYVEKAVGVLSDVTPLYLSSVHALLTCLILLVV